MGFISRYLTIGALLLALAGSGWGWREGQRAAGLEIELRTAQATIARLQAEALTREKIDHAVDQVQRLDGRAIADWLRARAGGK